MIQYSKSDKAMEAGNHYKNMASSKSRMNRGYFFKYFGIIALASVITVIICSFGVASQSERWEYQVVSAYSETLLGNTEKELNNLGREGWELISVVSWNPNLKGESLVYTLKRRMR
jgi:hypothetical protein